MKIQALRFSSTLAIALGLLPAGCYHGGGSKTVHAGPAVIFETEINDFAAAANFIGFVRPGDSFVLEGDMGFGGDFQDGFAFVADVPVQVEYVLSVFDGTSAFGVCVYDPYFDQVVFCDTSAQNPEVGAFFVNGFDTEFHIFLAHLNGAADYSLAVNVYPLGAAPEALGDDNGSSSIKPLAPAAQAIAPSTELIERSESYRVGKPQDAQASAARARKLTQVGQLIVVEGEQVRALPIYQYGAAPDSSGSPRTR